MELYDDPTIKHGYATHAVPLAEMFGSAPMYRAPRVGDLVLAEVLSIGRHKTIEVRSGVTMYLFPGDTILASFGHRYAPDQYEGYVPAEAVEECDLLSVGGVCGRVSSRHAAMGEPSRLRILGGVLDREGRQINQRDYGLRDLATDHLGGIPRREGRGEVILVVGSSMNAGKTTAVGTIARALSRTGLRVAAAKVTGTAAGKDGRFFESCGARPALDFTSVGCPSTYMLELEDLENIYSTLLANLRAADPDYLIVEIADGIFQRETRMLLESDVVRESVDHVFFAAAESLAVHGGVRFLQEMGMPLRATAGALTQSPLAIREAEEATGVPCLSVENMMKGGLAEVLGVERDEAAEPPNGRSQGYAMNTVDQSA